ncbi:hypothetical protein EMN47_08575 [Prolixibacteraceae bacterium JC049]|nr:hypothetical protein [Prolixibacteraceae bacterium JC049]
MKISEVAKLMNARIVCGEHRLEEEIKHGFGSDLMSDVLRTEAEQLILITGLANLQTIRTAEMADIEFILFVRDKKATDEMVELAKENNLVVLETSNSMFKASGILFQAGLTPVF